MEITLREQDSGVFREAARPIPPARFALAKLIKTDRLHAKCAQRCQGPESWRRACERISFGAEGTLQALVSHFKHISRLVAFHIANLRVWGSSLESCVALLGLQVRYAGPLKVYRNGAEEAKFGTGSEWQAARRARLNAVDARLMFRDLGKDSMWK